MTSGLCNKYGQLRAMNNGFKRVDVTYPTTFCTLISIFALESVTECFVFVVFGLSEGRNKESEWLRAIAGLLI
jgi:hypothetical protein